MSCSPVFFLHLPLSLLPFHSYVLISLYTVIILLYQSCQFPFFVSPVPSFIFLICLNLPCSRQAAYLSALSLSRVVSERWEKKKTESGAWLRLKGQGHCLKQSGCRMPFIYRLLHTARASWGARAKGKTNTHNTMPWQQWHPKHSKRGTFRQTYGFVLLGWALCYHLSHLITPDMATATVCLQAHTHLAWQKETHLTDRCLNHSS